MLRPLRLTLSAEKLRTTRILLLKVTHFPHVLVIMAYENLRIYVATRRSNDTLMTSSAKPLSLSERPRLYKHYSRTNRLSSAQPLAAASLKPSTLLGDERGSQESSASQPHTATSMEDIKAVLAQLTTQIEQLTRRVEGQTS